MKSAFELALERSGGALGSMSEDQKQALAEIERRYKAKLAEIDIVYSDKLKAAALAGDPKQLEQLKEDMAVEQASVRDQAERDKAEVRSQSRK